MTHDSRLLGSSRRSLAAWGLAAAFASSSVPAAAMSDSPSPAAVTAIATRVDQHGSETRLLFELSGPIRVETFVVAEPDRIIVDLPEVAFPLDPMAGREVVSAKAAGASSSLIRSYRFGEFAPGRSRIVIELARPAKVLRAESVTRAEGARLEIDLAPVDAAKFMEAAAEHTRAVAEKSAPATPTPVAERPPAAGDVSEKPLVVIDPGHGGVDVGAAGKHGELEKSIVFEFAKTLKATIESQGRLRVLLTRADDVFIALDDRVRFARQHGAALFLSIHADTLGSPNVEGATVYTVASRASDAEAARTAQKENFADQSAGLDQKAEAEEIGDILFDLTRRETRALARDFSASLVSKWREAGSLNKNPSRSASFVVLKAHDVPSALLELGYLSSAKDLANLVSPEWRERAARATADAIDAYFSARDNAARASTK
ncbi:MAG: N-acetylmuramoyl-L-alanine amidase [Methylocystis sp.]